MTVALESIKGCSAGPVASQELCKVLQQQKMAMKALGYMLSVTMIYLLVIIMIAHSAPINKRHSGVSITDKAQQFYCTSELIKLQVQYMVKVCKYS